MTSTSSLSHVSLTVVLQPTQSAISTEPYLYSDAVNDALGNGYSHYIGSPESRNNTLFLWESGCRIGDTWNCTLACSDSETGLNMVWNSSDAMFTLQNCLVYPILATAAAYEWLEQDPPDLLDNFGITPHEMMPINTTTDAERSGSAWPVINGCLKRACSPFNGYKAEDECSGYDTRSTAYLAGSTDNVWNVSLTFDGSSRLCSMGTDTPNADIGGPGVMLSIMQQVTILMVIWLLLSSIGWLRSGLRIFSHRIHGSGAQRTKKLSAPGRQTAALIIALQEFQKTQAFLLLAIQVVSLLALEHATWLDASTPLQLTMNAAFMMLLSTAGVYPIILGLLTLRKSKGRLEWFTLIMSLACVVVSSVTWARVSRIDLYAIQQQSDITFEECGGINPTRYCLGPGMSLRSSMDIGSVTLLRQRITIGPVCVLLYLVLENILPAATRHNLIWAPSWAKKDADSGGHRFKWIPSWVPRVLQVFVLLCAEAWLLWGNIMIFMNFYSVWEEFSDEGMVWTFGQVIAVAVWVPVFLEWLYTALLGIEANFSVRLPKNYKVVKSDMGGSVASNSKAISTKILPDDGRHSNATLSSYELLPNPTGDYHRVAHPYA